MIPGINSGILGAFRRRGITQTDNRTAYDSTSFSNKTYNSVNFGTNTPGSFVLIIAIHGDTNANPGTTPTCTMNGTSATRYEPHSTGDNTSGNDATGSVIFIAQPSANGDVVVNWATSTTPVAITVFRVAGYSATPSSTHGGSASTGDTTGSASFNIAAGGAVVGASGSGQDNTARTWSNLTQRLEENFGGANNRRSIAWNVNMAANASLTISTSPYSTAQGSSTWSAVVLTPA